MKLNFLLLVIQLVLVVLFSGYLNASENKMLLSSLKSETKTHEKELFIDGDSRQRIEAKLDKFSKLHDLVGLGMVISDSEYRSSVFVSGKRTIEGSEAIETSDAWHIGSNTKALTALLFARLVDLGLADWQTSLADYFPDMKHNLSPEWRDMTIQDLFAHRSGLGRLGPTWIIPARLSQKPVNELRKEDVYNYLSKPPKLEIGKWKYSNLNYIIAGAAIESLLAKKLNRAITWEQAIQDYVITGVSNAKARESWGFGPPEHIEGHRNSRFEFGGLKSVGKGVSADNPRSLGPAGTIHVSLKAHAYLLVEFLKNNSRFISGAQKKVLLTPYPNDLSDYAMGWKVARDKDIGLVYFHSGSNTMWLSFVLISPELDRVIIINTNRSSNKLPKAIKNLAFEILIK